MGADTRSTDQVEADIAAARARLSANLTDLISEVHPKVFVQRQKDEAKASAKAQWHNLKSQFVDDNGVRVDRVAAIGGAVLGTVTFLLVVRGIVKASSKDADK